MSYDFRLCLPQPGRSREEIATADVEDGVITDPVPEREERKKRIEASLLAHNPALEPFTFEFEKIAEFERISIEEAKKKHRHIALNGPDGGNGIQIMLFDEEASVTVPYWHQGSPARKVFEEIWIYLEIIEHVGGFFTYDPQIERIIDLREDFEASLASYDRVSRYVAQRLPFRQRKRWWEFWK
jgi:hypothetical protein